MSYVENSTEGRSSNTVANKDDRGNSSSRGFTTSRILDSQNNVTKLSPIQLQQQRQSQQQSQQQQQQQQEEKPNDNLETMEYSMDDKPHLPSIPVAMRFPHIVSSVKQYRTEEQHKQLKQSFVSEAFISMMPNVTKPPRKRRRPPFSYSSLIAQAILEAENERLTLREIYDWIVKKYPSLYGANDIGWQVRRDPLWWQGKTATMLMDWLFISITIRQNTIRHNLSLNRCFKKLPKQDSDTSAKGKGGYWTIDSNHMMKFKNGAFARGSSSTLRRKPISDHSSSQATTAAVAVSPESRPTTSTEQQYSPTLRRYPTHPEQQQQQHYLSPSTSSAPSTRSPSPSLYTTLQPIEPPPLSTCHVQSSPSNVTSTSSSLPIDTSASPSASSSCTVMNIHNLLNWSSSSLFWSTYLCTA